MLVIKWEEFGRGAKGRDRNIEGAQAQDRSLRRSVWMVAGWAIGGWMQLAASQGRECASVA